MRQAATPDGAMRLMQPEDVARCVFEAYHGDRVHWYVPEEMEKIDRARAGGVEPLRDQFKRTVLGKHLIPPLGDRPCSLPIASSTSPTEDGMLCGQILADLGADVIQVEPPERIVGAPRRALARTASPGPSARSSSRPTRATSASLALDLDDAADRAHLRAPRRGRRLPDRVRIARAAWRSSGLGYADLGRSSRAWSTCRSRPSGRPGPKAHWRGSDLTQVAAGGFAYLTGEADDPPTRVCVPQAHAHAGADAAIGALIAHAERRRTGRGQHVDVSTQQSVTLANMYRTLDAAVGMAPAQRVAGGIQAGGVLIPMRHRTRDGWVTLGPVLSFPPPGTS